MVKLKDQLASNIWFQACTKFPYFEQIIFHYIFPPSFSYKKKQKGKMKTKGSFWHSFPNKQMTRLLRSPLPCKCLI